MDGDHPITRREEDRLGFAPIAERLARAIIDQSAPQGFVFGIEGKWGSGKTTLINLTVDALKTYGPRAPEIVSFSPWLVGNRDELMQTLFDELAAAAVKIDPLIDSNAPAETQSPAWRKLWRHADGNEYWKLREKERFKKALGPKLRAFGAVAGAFGKFARTADSLGIPRAALAGSVIERGGEAAQSLLAEESLSKRKAQLVDALKLLSRRIVVFVDDLDRLEPREASEVLRLIRAVADFPNIIYVLSYDPVVMAQTLSKAIQVDDGAAFLEKIVQVSFRVPRPEAFDLRRWFLAEVRKLFSSQLEMLVRQEATSDSRLLQVIDKQGGRYLETGRDVIRVLNALQLHAVPVAERIDIADMVWLQLLKIGNPDFYCWVEEYVTELAAVASGRAVSVPEKERSILAERLDKILAAENANDIAIIELGGILPGLEFHVEEPHKRLFANLDKRTLAPFIASKRFGSPQHYRYYFAFAQPTGALSDQQVQAFIDSASASPDDAILVLLNLAREERPQGGTLAELLIDRLNVWVDRIPDEAIPGIIKTLGQSMDTDELAVAGDFDERFTWRAATQLLRSLRRRASIGVQKATIELFKYGRAVGWLTSIIREEIFAHGLHGDRPKPEIDWLLHKDEFSDILDVMLNRYRDIPPEELMRVPELLGLLYTWREGGRDKEVREWVDAQTATDAGLLTLLSRVRSWMEVNGVRYHPLNQRDLQNFLDVDHAVRRLKVISLDNEASQNQRGLASELLAAIRQGDVRPYIGDNA